MSDIKVKFEGGNALCSTACPRLTIANGHALSACATTAQHGGYCGPWYRERVAEVEAEVEAIHDALRDREPTMDSSTAREVYGVIREVARLRAENADAKALAYNSTVPRSEDDQKDTLDDQIVLLVERFQAEVERLMAVRKPVRWFAEQMERKLKANDHKSHWKGCDPHWLLDHLRQEVEELKVAFKSTRPFGCFVDTPEDVEQVIDEAADVANFAMMIADNARAALAGEVPE